MADTSDGEGLTSAVSTVPPKPPDLDSIAETPPTNNTPPGSPTLSPENQQEQAVSRPLPNLAKEYLDRLKTRQEVVDTDDDDFRPTKKRRMEENADSHQEVGVV